MRRLPMLLLAGLLAGACNDPSGPAGGALLVSTSMTGAEADTDGWKLVVDGEPLLTLRGNDRKELALDGGTHTLDLEGLDAPCTVEPAVPFEVRVSGGDRITVDLAVNCPPTGAIVTPHFTGLDIPAFYRVAVDGVPANSVQTNAATTLTRLSAGEHTFELLDSPANCTADGPSAKTVTVIAGAFVPLDFAVRCVASTGVIKILVTTEGEDAPLDYRAEIDGSVRPFTLEAPFHLSGVAGGEHAVKLSVPLNCVVEDDARSVTIEVGGQVRDTVEVEFLVTCVRLRATLRVVTTTSGTIPDVEGYDVYLWEGLYYYDYPTLVGRVDPSGALEIDVRPGTYRLSIGAPSGCGPTPVSGPFTIGHGLVYELPFEVVCAP